MQFLSKNESETAKTAIDFIKSLAEADFGGKAAVVGLYGELGSGKTTFVKFLAKNMGLKNIIQSPTFVIEKIYDISPLSPGRIVDGAFERFIHIDAYRIEKEEEMINLGWNELLSDPKNFICIEWPERIEGILPSHIMIRFEHGEKEGERKISIT